MRGLLYFLPLCAVIAAVLSAVKKDSPRDILVQAARVFLLLTLGTVAFSALLYVCTGSQAMLFGFTGLIIAFLAFFTLKGAVEWLWAGIRPGKAGREKAEEKVE